MNGFDEEFSFLVSFEHPFPVIISDVFVKKTTQKPLHH